MDKKEMDNLVELAMAAFDKNDVGFKPSMRRAVKAVLDYMAKRDRELMSAEDQVSEDGAEWVQQGDVILRPRGAEKFRLFPSSLS